VPSASAAVLPIQTVTAPEGDIATGPVVTVTTALAEQPPLNEYFIVSVPAITPVTIPVLPTVAIVLLLLLQVPPGVMSAKCVVCAVHTFNVPVIGDTPLVTVTTIVSQHPDGGMA
jgi:hypothetical protein